MVFIFIFATVGLLGWSAVKPWVARWVEVSLPFLLPSFLHLLSSPGLIYPFYFLFFFFNFYQSNNETGLIVIVMVIKMKKNRARRNVGIIFHYLVRERLKKVVLLSL